MKPEELNDAREALGFTIKQMAEAMGVDRDTWGKWVRGARRPNNAALQLIKHFIWLHYNCPAIFARMTSTKDSRVWCGKCQNELLGWEEKQLICDYCVDSAVEADKLLLDVYLSLHVSQAKYCSAQIRAVWKKGQAIHEAVRRER